MHQIGQNARRESLPARISGELGALHGTMRVIVVAPAEHDRVQRAGIFRPAPFEPRVLTDDLKPFALVDSKKLTHLPGCNLISPHFDQHVWPLFEFKRYK